MILKSGFVKVTPRQPEIRYLIRRAGGKKSKIFCAILSGLPRIGSPSIRLSPPALSGLRVEEGRGKWGPRPPHNPTLEPMNALAPSLPYWLDKNQKWKSPNRSGPCEGCAECAIRGTPGETARGSYRQLPQLVAKFTKSAAITHSLLTYFFFVRANCSQFSASSAFVAIVEAFVAIVVARVAVARPYLDASGSTLRKRGGRNGKECRGSHRKDVSAHKHLHDIIARKLPLRVNFPKTVFVPLITELLSLAQAHWNSTPAIRTFQFLTEFARHQCAGCEQRFFLGTPHAFAAMRVA